MRKQITAAALLCALATPSLAENSPAPHHPAPHHQAPPPVIAPKASATAVGTGVGIANSSSQSGAVAISGQGGNSSSSSALTVNSPATSTVNSTISGTTTSNINQRVSGTTTVRSAPPIAAPSLSAAGLETCLGSASGGVSAVGFGITGGASIVDEGCQARLDSRTLASYGLKAAAVARLCQRVDIWRSMPDICAQYWPVGMPYPYGVAAAEYAPTGGLPVKALMSADRGAIRVVDGRDGVEKDCLHYSAAKQKCFRWAGEPRQRVASVNPTKSIAPTKPKAGAKPLAPETAVAKSPAVQAIDAATSAQPKKED